MEYDICVFTSTHPANDTRIFRKEVITLLKAGYRILYYTNQNSQNITNTNLQEEIAAYPNLTVVFNKRFNIDRRIGRFIRSLGMFFWINKRCKVYHFHDPDLIITGSLLKLAGKKVIYDVHENYVDGISEKPYLSKVSRKVLSSLYKHSENLLCKRFDLIITATPSIKASYDKRRFKTVQVIYNYPYRQELLPGKSHANPSKSNTFIYVGGITEIRGITDLVKAVEEANKIKPIKLVLAGPIFPASYEGELKALNGWKYVEYLGTISRANMTMELSQAICGVCILKPMKDYIESLPTKIFEYMSAGLPTLSSNFKLWKELVIENDIGYVCDPEDIHSISNSLIKISNLDQEELKSKGRNGIELIQTKYSWENEEKELLNLYQKILS